MFRALSMSAAPLLCATAHAQLLVPVSQDRYADALAEDCNYLDTEHRAAADFGPFAVNVEAGTDYNTSDGSARHISSLLGDTLSYDLEGEGFSDNWCGGCSEGQGDARFLVEFDVTQDVSYCLDGGVSAYYYGTGMTVLRDAQGGIIAAEYAGYNQFESFRFGGVLAAGRYTLEARAVGGAGSFCDLDYDGGIGYAAATFIVVPLAQSYCTAAANSAGPGASLSHSGSQHQHDDDFTLQASGLPSGVFGLYFFGPTQIQVPFGDGFRCVGGTTRRLQPAGQADGAGVLTRTLDFGAGAAATITPMTPWNFQLWYRDPTGPGGSGFNTSDGLEVVFCN